jgi:hypothetical protein
MAERDPQGRRTCGTVKDDASEACQTECTEKTDKLKAEKGTELEEAKLKEVYDTCYTKCVAEEAKDIVEERAKVLLPSGRPVVEQVDKYWINRG